MSQSQSIPLSRIRRPNSAYRLSGDPPEDTPFTGSSRQLNDGFYPFALDLHAPDVQQPAWKRSLHDLLEQPTSSAQAFFIHVFISFLIVLSAIITILETVPAFHSIPGSIWFGLETTLIALFTVEYITRCLAWSATWKSLLTWVFSFFGIVDLLAIMPYYIELLLHQDTSVLFRFSILRTFRLLRVFRPFRHNNTILLTIEVMYVSVRRSQHALFAIGFFVAMVLTVFSTLLYFAERGTWDATLETFVNANGDPTQFTSIPAAAWFVLVTITTVGYGEITPRSFLGRLITSPLLVFGLLLIALPSFVLGREFSIVWERMSNNPNHAQDEPTLPSSPPSLLPPPTAHEPATANSQLLISADIDRDVTTQISELRTIIEGQSEILNSLMDAIGRSKGKQREGNGSLSHLRS